MSLEVIDVTSPDGTKNRGIFAWPSGTPPFPGILAVHGGMGGWSEADLKLHAKEKIPAHLVAAGYAVLISDYRHLSLGLGDVQDTIAAYHALCADSRVDTKRTALVGCSHGGVNSLLAARSIRPTCIVAEEAQTDAVNGWEVLQNVIRRSPKPLPEYVRKDKDLWEEVRQRLGGLPHEVPEAYIAESAYTKAAEIESPVLILAGDSEYRPSSIKMHEALIRAGKSCELKLYENAPHAFLWNGVENPATKVALNDVLKFLRVKLANGNPKG